MHEMEKEKKIIRNTHLNMVVVVVVVVENDWKENFEHVRWINNMHEHETYTLCEHWTPSHTPHHITYKMKGLKQKIRATNACFHICEKKRQQTGRKRMKNNNDMSEH